MGRCTERGCKINTSCTHNYGGKWKNLDAVYVWISDHSPECGMSGCSILWQGDSGSSTGPLRLATPPGRRTSMHCSSSSACWATGRPIGARAWLTSPSGLRGQAHRRDTPGEDRQYSLVRTKARGRCTFATVAVDTRIAETNRSSQKKTRERRLTLLCVCVCVL